MKAQAKKETKQRVQKIIRKFRKYYPSVKCALNYTAPHELLIATILSAQCTDKRVNEVTKTLFKKYKTVEEFAEASVKDLEKDVHSTGFYKNKAKNIKKCCEKLRDEHKSDVPKDIDALTGLAGVGRKTANVVLGNAFNIASGVVVDTHVSRISYRLGLTPYKSPVAIEEDLNGLVPKKDWIIYSHWLIEHGRQVCLARSPKCKTCFLEELCPKKKYKKL